MPFGIALKLRELSNELNQKLIVKFIPAREYSQYRSDMKNIRRSLDKKYGILSGRQWRKRRKQLKNKS